MQAALELGAEAVQVGTAFLATTQSGASPEHRRALAHGPRRTRLTRAITGRLARALATRVTTEEPVAPFPYQAMLMYPLTSSGDPDFRAFWAGQGAPLVRPDRDAVELLRELAGARTSLEA